MTPVDVIMSHFNGLVHVNISIFIELLVVNRDIKKLENVSSAFTHDV